MNGVEQHWRNKRSATNLLVFFLREIVGGCDGECSMLGRLRENGRDGTDRGKPNGLMTVGGICIGRGDWTQRREWSLSVGVGRLDQEVGMNH